MGRHLNDGKSVKPQVDIRPNRGRMGILSDKKIAYSAVFHTVLGIIGWPFAFFTISEEDRLKAGIGMGNEVGEIELSDRKEYINEKIQIQ